MSTYREVGIFGPFTSALIALITVIGSFALIYFLLDTIKILDPYLILIDSIIYGLIITGIFFAMCMILLFLIEDNLGIDILPLLLLFLLFCGLAILCLGISTYYVSNFIYNLQLSMSMIYILTSTTITAFITLFLIYFLNATMRQTIFIP